MKSCRALNARFCPSANRINAEFAGTARDFKSMLGFCVLAGDLGMLGLVLDHRVVLVCKDETCVPFTRETCIAFVLANAELNGRKSVAAWAKDLPAWAPPGLPEAA